MTWLSALIYDWGYQPVATYPVELPSDPKMEPSREEDGAEPLGFIARWVAEACSVTKRVNGRSQSNDWAFRSVAFTLGE